MRIGELAKRAGVSVQTIRFYERRGLLKEPPRTPSGYRVYASGHLQVVQLIRRAQHFGFKLEEIRRLVQLCPLAGWAGQPPLAGCERGCVAEIARMCEGKLAELDNQIRMLSGVRKELATMLHAPSRIVPKHNQHGPRCFVIGISNEVEWKR